MRRGDQEALRVNARQKSRKFTVIASAGARLEAECFDPSACQLPVFDPVRLVGPMIATAVKSMAAFEHTDPAFTADAPPLSPTEPALPFVRAPRGRPGATTRQHDSADTALGRRPFGGRRAEAAIAGGEIIVAVSRNTARVAAISVR
jgi:hypothetical protein